MTVMGDEPTPTAVEAENVPTEPAQGGTSEQDNYEQRYNDLRPQYDRTQNELAQLKQWQQAIRNDPEAQAQLLAELGFEVPTDDTDPTFDDDPIAALKQELEQRLAAVEQHTASAQEEQELAKFEAHTQAAFRALDKDGNLDDDDKEWIVAKALTQPPAENGMPDIHAAYQAHKAREEKWAQAWAASKRTSHRVSQAGGAGIETPDLDDPEQRVAWMAARAQELADNS